MNNKISRSLSNEHTFQVSDMMTRLNEILTSANGSMSDMSFSMGEVDLKLITEDDVPEKCELECKKALKILIIENKPETIAVIQQLGGCCANPLDFHCLRAILIEHGIIKFSSLLAEFCRAMVYLGLFPRKANELPNKAAERLRTGMSHVPLSLNYKEWKNDLERAKLSPGQKNTMVDKFEKKKLNAMKKGVNIIEYLLRNMPDEYRNNNNKH